jgi:hypothetical protein
MRTRGIETAAFLGARMRRDIALLGAGLRSAALAIAGL